MAKLAIKGHPTRGKEVIEILEMLGGINTYTLKAVRKTCFYFIVEGEIDYDVEKAITDEYTIFTLEEFLEKFPYKVGDKVKVCGDNLGVIISMRWEIDCVVYKVKLSKNGYETSKTSENLQPYKEETMDKVSKAVFDANAQCCDITNRLIKEETMEEQSEQITVDIPNGYEFFGIDDNNKIVLTKKQPQYPKTYEECAQILLERASVRNDIGYKGDLLIALQRLLVCRDAYWKIAGEQMGLDKLWKPYNGQESCKKHVIQTVYDKVTCLDTWCQTRNILEFPTEEMRDAFYENFKELIESCKELL